MLVRTSIQRLLAGANGIEGTDLDAGYTDNRAIAVAIDDAVVVEQNAYAHPRSAAPGKVDRCRFSGLARHW